MEGMSAQICWEYSNRERSCWKWMDEWVGCTNCNESKWLKWKKRVRSCCLHFKDLRCNGDPATLLAVIIGVEEAMKGNGWNYGRTERNTDFVLYGELLLHHSMCTWWVAICESLLYSKASSSRCGLWKTRIGKSIDREGLQDWHSSSTNAEEPI